MTAYHKTKSTILYVSQSHARKKKAAGQQHCSICLFAQRKSKKFNHCITHTTNYSLPAVKFGHDVNLPAVTDTRIYGIAQNSSRGFSHVTTTLFGKSCVEVAPSLVEAVFAGGALRNSCCNFIGQPSKTDMSTDVISPIARDNVCRFASAAATTAARASF
jgi:hypothetical protein